MRAEVRGGSVPHFVILIDDNGRVDNWMCRDLVVRSYSQWVQHNQEHRLGLYSDVDEDEDFMPNDAIHYFPSEEAAREAANLYNACVWKPGKKG